MIRNAQASSADILQFFAPITADHEPDPAKHCKITGVLRATLASCDPRAMYER
jgi:hypothetical protein